MHWFERIAQRAIDKAAAEGKLSGLAGEGRPLDPERLRESADDVLHRMMADGGFLPPEVTLAREIEAAGIEPGYVILLSGACLPCRGLAADDTAHAGRQAAARQGEDRIGCVKHVRCGGMTTPHRQRVISGAPSTACRLDLMGTALPQRLLIEA